MYLILEDVRVFQKGEGQPIDSPVDPQAQSSYCSLDNIDYDLEAGEVISPSPESHNACSHQPHGEASLCHVCKAETADTGSLCTLDSKGSDGLGMGLRPTKPPYKCENNESSHLKLNGVSPTADLPRLYSSSEKASPTPLHKNGLLNAEVDSEDTRRQHLS